MSERPSRVAFIGRLYFCSNFFPRGMWLDRVWYKRREHAFQCGKFLDPRIQEEVRSQLHPRLAKWKAKEYQAYIRSDWYTGYSIEHMEKVVWEFFKQWPDLRMKLIDTGEEHLEERNTWGDTFWGTVNGKGENHLGEILMSVRSRLINLL